MGSAECKCRRAHLLRCLDADWAYALNETSAFIAECGKAPDGGDAITPCLEVLRVSVSAVYAIFDYYATLVPRACALDRYFHEAPCEVDHHSHSCIRGQTLSHLSPHVLLHPPSPR